MFYEWLKCCSLCQIYIDTIFKTVTISSVRESFVHFSAINLNIKWILVFTVSIIEGIPPDNTESK